MGIAMEGDPRERKNRRGSLDDMKMKVARFSRGKAANLGVRLLLSSVLLVWLLEIQVLVALPAVLLQK